jgi:glycosyltransferase involved in cell wall biosynthesis
MKNTFVISCPIDTYSGYGARSRDFVKALIELDEYDVMIIPQRWGNTPMNFIEDNAAEWGFIEKHILRERLSFKPDIWCQCTVPNEFHAIGKFNIGLTAGIETTVCHAEWIEGMNRMDHILTSSTHSKNVLSVSSWKAQDGREIVLNKPISVIPEGANLKKYCITKEFKNKELYNKINSIPEKFAFLAMGHWMQGTIGQDRKNIALTIKSFYEVFKNKNNQPALILKTSMSGSSYMDRREILHRINQIKLSLPKGAKLPKIYLLHGDFIDSDINELYNHPKIKAMISLTRGEGFGRPLLEFSLIDKPIITTGWSGQIDFLQPEFTCFVGGKLEKLHPTSVVEKILIPESEWFSPDHQQIAACYMDVLNNTKIWNEKAKKQGNFSRTNFHFDSMKTKIKRFLNQDIPPLPKMMDLNLEGIGDIKLPKKEKLDNFINDDNPKVKVNG